MRFGVLDSPLDPFKADGVALVKMDWIAQQVPKPLVIVADDAARACRA